MPLAPPLQVVTTKNVSYPCQMFPGGPNPPASIENYCLTAVLEAEFGMERMEGIHSAAKASAFKLTSKTE